MKTWRTTMSTSWLGFFSDAKLKPEMFVYQHFCCFMVLKQRITITPLDRHATTFDSRWTVLCSPTRGNNQGRIRYHFPRDAVIPLTDLPLIIPDSFIFLSCLLLSRPPFCCSHTDTCLPQSVWLQHFSTWAHEMVRYTISVNPEGMCPIILPQNPKTCVFEHFGSPSKQLTPVCVHERTEAEKWVKGWLGLFSVGVSSALLSLDAFLHSRDVLCHRKDKR